MQKEIVTALIAVLIVQCVEGSKDTSSNTSIPNESPEVILDKYNAKMCANEPTCDLVTIVPEKYQRMPRRGCMCDSDCVFYGDCCQDSKYYNKTENSKNHLNFYCNTDIITGVYIQYKCPPTYTDYDVVNKCHITSRSFRSMNADLSAIVTNPVTNISYANKYCAKCNRIDNYVSWNVTYACRGKRLFDFDEDFLEEASHFVKLNQTTSEFYADFKGVRLSCEQKIEPPRSTIDADYLRPCSAVISSCQNTTDTEIVNKCVSYMARVYDNRNDNNSYRNKHCAMCNGVPEHEAVVCTSVDDPINKMDGSGIFSRMNKAQGSGICGSELGEFVNQEFPCE